MGPKNPSTQAAHGFRESMKAFDRHELRAGQQPQHAVRACRCRRGLRRNTQVKAMDLLRMGRVVLAEILRATI
jgi:hypothetical protein